MRNPKKNKKPAGKGGKAKKAEPELMQFDAPSTSQAPTVWRPGYDPIGEDEELEYDPTAYDCLHRFQLDWPCLSFDILQDDLGAPRSTFPHTCFLVAGTQASTSRSNYIAFLKLGDLGQGRHGKKKGKGGGGDDDDDDESDDEDDDAEEGASSSGDEDNMSEDDGDAPARFHYRTVNHVGGINRIRAMPQKQGVVAVWGDNAQVKILDGSKLVGELAAEAQVTAKGKARQDLKPLAMHAHSTEGFAVDWSPVKAGRLATGDCRAKIYVWEPQEGGRWQVSAGWPGHEAGSSVEDLAWSPTEETVFASCGTDKTIRIWDTREKAKPMISVAAHDTDVNVISWSRPVTYMLASGADDGIFKVWDLRAFTADGQVAKFAYHRGPMTSIEWCPYEGSMLATTSADNQLGVWDLALERDPEEEAELAAAGNAMAPTDLPAQLLFLHAGQSDLKETHWHSQVPGLMVSTAGDGFNLFKASNM